MKTALTVMAVVAFLLPAAAGADESAKATNHFASVYIDDDKVGQVHVTKIPRAADETVDLKTNTSMSVLGIEVFHFTQTLHETWKGNDLLAMTGTTDDDGTKYETTLKRTANGYEGSVNGKTVTLPADSYPSSFWQYAITKAHAIFDLKDLSLWKVDIAESEETLDIDGASVPTERFDFTGGWTASLWFDKDHNIIQFDNQVRGHDVKVVMER